MDQDSPVAFGESNQAECTYFVVSLPGCMHILGLSFLHITRLATGEEGGQGLTRSTCCQHNCAHMYRLHRGLWWYAQPRCTEKWMPPSICDTAVLDMHFA